MSSEPTVITARSVTAAWKRLHGLGDKHTPAEREDLARTIARQVLMAEVPPFDLPRSLLNAVYCEALTFVWGEVSSLTSWPGTLGGPDPW